MKRTILGVVAAFAMAGAVNAAELTTDAQALSEAGVVPARIGNSSLGRILIDQNGMTLYTFDKDTQGASRSACAGDCIANWPPLLAAEGARPGGGWTIVDVVDADGMAKKMWAYDGWPLYLWVKDTNPGDVTGDMVGGVWHVVKVVE